MHSNRDFYKKGRLTARPDRFRDNEYQLGLQPLNLDNKRDGFVYVPESYSQENPAALALMLHGAGGTAEHGMSLIKEYSDSHNIIIISPYSREYSWDIIATSSFGPDVIYIDQALSEIFEKYNIANDRIAVGGFSDGASYALSLGISNGDIFTHVIAFSPGFVHTQKIIGEPKVFISHGTNDEILPIDPCSRRIAQQLKGAGFDPEYLEFIGGHEIPRQISSKAIDWFLKSS